MKNIGIWLGIILIWIIIFFKLLELYPNYILLIIDIMFALLAFCILGFFVLKMLKPIGITNFEKAKKSVLHSENLPKEKLLELIKNILYTNYSNLRKAKHNPYFVNFYNKKYIFSVIQDNYPIDVDIINQVNKGKTAFHVPFAIVICINDFTKEAFNLAEEKGIIIWNKKRLVEILDRNKKDAETQTPSKKNIHKTIKKDTVSIEHLDICDINEFKDILCNLLKKHYKYIDKKEKLYLFEIENKSYAIYMLQGNPKDKIEKKDIENIVNDIYKNNYSNAIILTNTYFRQEIIDWSHKLKIDLWNRDNINYMIEKYKI